MFGFQHPLLSEEILDELKATERLWKQKHFVKNKTS